MPKIGINFRKSPFKMRILFCLYVLSLLGTNAFGQKLSLQFSAGYGFPFASQRIAVNSVTTGNPQSSTTTQTNVYASLGGGVNVSAGIRWLFSSNVGLDLNVGYQSGSNAETFSSQGVGTPVNTESEYSSSSFILSPTLVFIARTEGLRPYGRIGLSLATVEMTIERSDYLFTSSGIHTINRKLLHTGDLTAGVCGGAGVLFGQTKALKVFAEIVVNSMSFYPTKGEMTRYLEDGKDLLITLDTNQRYADFVDQVSSTTPNDPNKPSQALKFDVAMSSVQVNLGVSFVLGRIKS